MSELKPQAQWELFRVPCGTFPFLLHSKMETRTFRSWGQKAPSPQMGYLALQKKGRWFRPVFLKSTEEDTVARLFPLNFYQKIC